jgi:hypothetical protein
MGGEAFPYPPEGRSPAKPVRRKKAREGLLC